MARVIRNHNTNLLKDPTPTDIKECSCCRKPECPLDKKCLSGCLVQNASVDRLDTNETKYYYGTCEKNFKERYNNHTAFFRNKSKELSTKISKYIWELKDNDIQHNLKWCIASRARPYVCGSRKFKGFALLRTYLLCIRGSRKSNNEYEKLNEISFNAITIVKRNDN